ncbi:HypC/HybG/HupF family hydrogenase formation chaperone [Cysteiniphilum sp. QT6929]|uniref:HypC/HybG/HupF family hydrogenase formation chaperone n=1 Tax=Cysteiniphilum sp. QT6929 TaxID=2975055 RepID=UPI0024B31FA8|nr:HypC/HybG/HupF family hydrogenase formation chaperone [Cysteiniphilum sp. QT6929]WHN66460.1 HypC/HybG/HupF family hydrogenase formation chaperone [Cysteiniphilum sp. QT6929]
MCLAIPAQIIALNGDDQALVNIGGVRKEISLALLKDQVDINDYVIVHVGFALSKLDESQAKQTLKDFADMLQQDRGDL